MSCSSSVSKGCVDGMPPLMQHGTLEMKTLRDYSRVIQDENGLPHLPHGSFSVERPYVVSVGCAGIVLLAAFALKFVYSRAGASELLWVLWPSCALAKLSGVQLSYEAGSGFISHRSRMVVGVACAGVNFLVASWLALYFTAERRCNTLRTKLGWMLVSLLAAYFVTVVVNGLRIVLAARLYAWPMYAGWWTPARAHRILGVVLYCAALFVLCSLAERGASSRAPTRLTVCRGELAPLLWYTGVVVALPLANRGLSCLSSVASEHSSALSAEHTLVTLGTAAGVLVTWRATAFMAVALRDRLSRRRH